jgi:glutathione S-transferase
MNTLVYFASRGRAEVIRLTLSEAGADWKDETFAIEDFPKLKASGRLPFQAVPLWEEDGGLRLAQSYAILQHVGRTHGMVGANPREQALVEQALGGVEDVRGEIRKLMGAAPEKRADIRSELVSKTLPRWFAMLEKMLASNAGGEGLLVGDRVTTADLALYYLLEMTADNDFGAALADAPKLQAFVKRIATRPKIAAYLSSPRRFKLTKLPS